MAVAARSPHVIAGGAGTLAILQAALKHVGLLDRGMDMIRHDRAWLHLEQDGREAGLGVGVEDLGLDAGEGSGTPFE